MRKNPTILLVLDITRAYSRQLIRGIAKYARLNGPWIFKTANSSFRQCLPLLEKENIDAIVTRDITAIEEALKRNIVVIAAMNEKKAMGLPTVSLDNVEIGKIGAEYFIERGFKNLAYCGIADMVVSEERGGSFRKISLEKNRNVFVYDWPSQKRKKKDPDLKNLMRWVDSLPHSTGILACSDDRAKQLIDVCKRLEIKVPEEIAVLGVENDDMICDLCFPPISSMKLDLEAGGYATGVLIQKLLLSPDKGNNKHIAIKPLYVVTRRSSDIFAIEDPVLAKAINFIEAHKRELITPEIVAMDAHVSLRSLQRFFKNNIHSSISDEIKKIRVKSIKELLVETDKSISQIAVEFGYKDAKHLSRYFRTITGISPIDFRRGYSIGYLGRDSK